MSDPRRESPDAVEAAAARWLARHDAGPLGAEDAAAFEAWRGADPRRAGAFIRLQAVNARLDRAGALSGLAADSRPRWRRLALPVAAAAALAIAAFPAALIVRHEMAVQRYATDIGEQYRAALADGSLVELNTATKVAVDLKPDAREVSLRKGEAVFEVARDKARPFVVRTPFGEVRAAGAAFCVRSLDGLRIAVWNGAVEVRRPGAEPVRVAAGEVFTLGPGGGAVQQTEPPEAIARATAWREGKLVFAGETLGQAVEELNRYNRTKVEIADPKVAAIEVGGYFRATDPGAFARALERSFPITAREEDGVIRLTARAVG